MSYARPDVLVSTDWVLEHHNDANLRLVEVNEDILLYDTGHIPGALKIDWQGDFWQPDIRDFIEPREFAQLMSRLGISGDTTVVLYGDKNNWWASYAFWFMTYNGHKDLKIMNGGRAKWVAENKPLTTDQPSISPSTYPLSYRDESIRAYRDEVLKHLLKVKDNKGALVDVRSLPEFTGERTHMPDYPQENVLRAGHIPGAKSIPWAQAANADGTFKSFDELTALYGNKGVTGDKEVIAYCRIAERSSHTWFVLKYLLGYPQVKNYDGSWTEWGNIVGMPIAKGEE